jgi:hypothetical protein
MLPSGQSNTNRTTGLDPEFREFALSREDEEGMIFISCEALPTVFIAVSEESAVRSAIDICLTNAFKPAGLEAHVFTNGTISGPTIHTVVKLTK